MHRLEKGGSVAPSGRNSIEPLHMFVQKTSKGEMNDNDIILSQGGKSPRFLSEKDLTEGGDQEIDLDIKDEEDSAEFEDLMVAMEIENIGLTKQKLVYFNNTN